ncbi:hypothetical protein BV25DRAFT_1822469 [Artomyces pyxidatus]|uniref:Uncharacterized protein n=1 Tax=Artomyces pyxidatus TaxID=48021 RepID=A0ACB8TAW2_9AGAM|nr:hypothetical protein BV25DRAFT_1822469 [Artomyces pyxidatus]
MNTTSHSKSSPVKRSTTGILAPQYNTPNDVFTTGLLTPQPSQLGIVADAAKTLISPPPEEDEVRPVSRQLPLHARAGSEPVTSLNYLQRAGPSSKRKRTAPLASALEEEEIDHGQQLPDVTPNPKPRKQKRRARFDDSSDDEGETSETARKRRAGSEGVRQKRQSHAVSPSNSGSRRAKSPSPTKASRRSPSLLKSPHGHNVNADYIPPLPSHSRHLISSRARSSTPIPVYEPPAERFTPPREVLVTPSRSTAPRVSKSSKRKTDGSARKVLKLVIKTEPPEIDLSKPAPPPSPTDDPLLLHGRLRRRSAMRSSPMINSRVTPPLDSTPPGPGSRPSPIARSQLDFSFVPMPESDDAPEEPVFDLAGAVDDPWSASDDDEEQFEEAGEYTGKFRMTSVPTKMDPPTSNTRERMEHWGRPISPFPLKRAKITSVPEQEDEDEEMEDVQEPVAGSSGGGGATQEADAQDLDTSHEAIDQPEQIDALDEQVAMDQDEDEVGPQSPEPDMQNRRTRSHSEESDGGRRETSPLVYSAPDANSDSESQREAGRHRDNSLDRQDERSQTSPKRSPSPRSSQPRGMSAEEEQEAVVIHREPSVEPQNGEGREDDPVVVEEEDEPMVEVEDEVNEEREGDSSDDESDLSMVKIVSDDPWAAARAAAILKEHDWDLIPKVERKRPSSHTVDALMRNARRAGVASAGVSKSSPSRRRSVGLVVGERVIMPGTPSMTLPQLLHEAESELIGSGESVRGTPTRFIPPTPHAFRTPSPALGRQYEPSGSTVVIDTDGPRDWTKDDWKILDACFTDARLEIGERWGGENGVLGDVDLVALDDVVDRFVELMGGPDVITALGPSWTRADLLTRARALQKKQRSGEVAPPTPSLRSTSVSSSTPTVPDFTPVHPARRLGHPMSQPKLSAPAFASHAVFSEKPKLPPSLMAPRYSHLMAEAVTVNRSDISKTRPSSAGTSDNTRSSTSSSDSSPPTWQTEPTRQESPATVGSRVKGFFFSYLPTLSKSKPGPKLREPARPGLPLPPPEILEKPRGPVNTPVREPAPKPPHPKEVVNLHHAPVLPSKIPQLPRQKPQRLVDLRPVSPVPEPTPAVQIPKGRRSSGGSVKDLVNSFEELDRSKAVEKEALQLRRQKSVGRLAGAGKPAWR